MINFKCVVCGKAFSRSTLLRRHEKVHSDQPKFLCNYCERPFLSREEWEKHTQNHQKKRPFSCEFCGKSFAFKQGLERHEVVHSTNQPFKCEHCDQGFSTQGKLARHLTAHAGDRPYPCRICDKSYLLSHHLTRHMRSHKENNQIAHKCTECNLSFSKRDELISHSSVHATENLVCPLCKTCFENSDDVDGHIKQHTNDENFACDFCDLIFLSETQLQEHSDAQHMEEIEFDMANDEDSLDDSADYRTVKAENDEIIEYTEQVEVITPHEVEDASPKIKANTRSYSKTNAKTPPIIKSEKGAKVADKVKEENEKGKSTTQATIRSPNTRASVMAKAAATPATPVDKHIDTKPHKTTPNKQSVSEKTTPTVDAKKVTSQTTLTKFITVKSKANESATTPQTLKKLIPLPTVKSANNDKSATTSPQKVANVANKLVKVKQIRMTKAQIEALAKEGKIEVRGGQVIFKKVISPKKK